ncbi:hypothetical protein AAHE18_03G178100 [Arachis hypogaea]
MYNVSRSATFFSFLPEIEMGRTLIAVPSCLVRSNFERLHNLPLQLNKKIGIRPYVVHPDIFTQVNQERAHRLPTTGTWIKKFKRHPPFISIYGKLYHSSRKKDFSKRVPYEIGVLIPISRVFTPPLKPCPLS